MKTDFERTGKTYRKIDIYVRGAKGWEYLYSTNQWRTCATAKASFLAKRKDHTTGTVKARFA